MTAYYLDQIAEYNRLKDHNEPIDHYQAVQWVMAEKVQERKARLFFLLCLLFGCIMVASVGCGRSQKSIDVGPVPLVPTVNDHIPSGLDIDDGLQADYQSFMDYGNAHGYNMNSNADLHSIKYVDSLKSAGENTIGLCTMYQYDDGKQNRKIEILNSITDPMELKLVMYHELGHCILNLQHTPENSNTIMQPAIIWDWQWASDNWDALVKAEFDSESK